MRVPNYAVSSVKIYELMARYTLACKTYAVTPVPSFGTKSPNSRIVMYVFRLRIYLADLRLRLNLTAFSNIKDIPW